MIVSNITDLPFYNKIGIIVNVGTKYVTTLALLSSMRYLKIPILIIDCDSQDGSYDFFLKLMKDYEFHLVKLPLKKHGYTIDFIFNSVNADHVYLIDSDVELINSYIYNFINQYIDHDNVFGAGYIHEPSWLAKGSEIRGLKYGYFSERMWIPLTCLKTKMVREALNKQISFINKNLLNDFYFSQFISKILIARQLVPFLKNTRLSLLNIFKRSYNGQLPSYVVYDTGAKVYEYLKYTKQYDYVGIPARYHEESVLHYHGVTRKLLDSNDRNAHELNDYNTILKKLRDMYNIDIIEDL